MCTGAYSRRCFTAHGVGTTKSNGQRHNTFLLNRKPLMGHNCGKVNDHRTYFRIEARTGCLRPYPDILLSVRHDAPQSQGLPNVFSNRNHSRKSKVTCARPGGSSCFMAGILFCEGTLYAGNDRLAADIPLHT